MYQICNSKNETIAHAHSYTSNRPKEYFYQLINSSGTGPNTTNSRTGVFILKHTEDEFRSYSMAFDQECKGNSDTGLDSAVHHSSSSPTKQAFYKQHKVMKNAEEQKQHESSEMQPSEYSPCSHSIDDESQNQVKKPNLWKNGKSGILYDKGMQHDNGIQDGREFSDSDESGESIYIKSNEMQNESSSSSGSESQSERPEEGHLRSSSHYRKGNPWGGMSYADLITAAILSAKNKRMTLEQIYQWLVTNVPYFGDKGDDSSRVGWKNSIRCNLSTRKRFMHIPRSSQTGVKTYRGWWTVNEAMISRKKRDQLLMMFEEANQPSRSASSVTDASHVEIVPDSPLRTTDRETQTDVIRFCETCHYFRMLLAPYLHPAVSPV